MHLPGAADTAAFVTYIDEVLCPTLQAGDIVMMDNLAVHKSPLVEALVRDAGAEVRFLPAYSPDFNTIAKMWSKIKEFLRQAKARTKEDLYDAIARALEKVTPQDSKGWFFSCGYTASQP